MDLEEIGFVDVHVIHLDLDRDQWRGSCELHKESAGSMKDGGFLDQNAVQNTILEGYTYIREFGAMDVNIYIYTALCTSSKHKGLEGM